MAQDNPNWIAERAKCDMRLIWAAVCDMMIENVARLNNEATQHGGWPPSSTPDKDACLATRLDGATCSWKYDGHQHRTVFTMTDPDRSACLTTRWDAESSQCRLVVQLSSDPQKKLEFPHDQLWKALQYILEPFFFPTPT